MVRKYCVAGHTFAVCGNELCNEVLKIDGFVPFAASDDAQLSFSFHFSDSVPSDLCTQYRFEYEDVVGEFGVWECGFLLKLKPAMEEPLYLWCKEGGCEVFLYGNFSIRLFRFALWVGYGLMTYNKGTIAIHSSCIVADGSAVIFLGESGTGKSTHTRLWRENIPGAVLLNDDSPVVRVHDDGSVLVYGSPWSGKTPCYKQESYPLAGCVRLSQAPYNKIHKLHVLKGYAALHPSCPPEFAYDERIFSHISSTLSSILKVVPCWHLECLPDADAARLSYTTILPR